MTKTKKSIFALAVSLFSLSLLPATAQTSTESTQKVAATTPVAELMQQFSVVLKDGKFEKTTPTSAKKYIIYFSASW